MTGSDADFLEALVRRCEGELSAELLGATYERSVAETSRRKGGGVYYTPEFLVDAIVERTLGPLVEGASPERVLGIRVVDPACGAGSFLLGAYEYLLNWHARYYDRAEAPIPPGIARRDAAGRICLTQQKKREIMSACIHGVDLDPRAVLVARLSLYWKLFEDEEKALSIPPWGHALDPFFSELARNVMCGNALIDADAFHWTSDAAGFGRILRPEGEGGLGGFDAVLGNPPYIRVQALAEFSPIEVALYKQRYASASEGNYDIYVAFIERSLSLLRPGGRSGFIIPTKWWQAAYGAPLRKLLTAGRHFAEGFDFGNEQAFEDPTTYTSIAIFTKDPAEAFSYCRASPAAIRKDGIERAKPLWKHDLSFHELGEGPWYPGVRKPLRPLFERLRREGPFLNDPSICPRIFQGIKTSLDPVYVLDIVEPRGDNILVRSKALNGAELLLERGPLKPIVKAGEMKRYSPLVPRKVVLFPYAVTDEGPALLSPSRIREQYPAVWEYLRKHKKRLENRERGRMKHAAWYAYIYPKNLALFGRPKILTADMAKRMAFSYDGAGDLCFLGGAGGGFGLLLSRPELVQPLLALLNSSLLEWMLRPPGFSSPFRGGWFSCEARFINLLPIRFPSAPADLRALAELSERALTTHKKLRHALSEGDQAIALRQIEAAEGEIDDRVFRLYGVGDAERRAIEEIVMEARRESGAEGF